VTNGPTNADSSAPAFPQDAVAELIRSLGQAFANADLYGLDHKISVTAMEAAYEDLQRLLEEVPRLRLALADGELSVNGHLLPLRNPLMLGFVERLRIMNVSGFTLSQGMTADEFVTLTKLLATRGAATDGQAFSELLAASNLSHIEASSTVLREIAEDEIVVNRDEAGKPSPEAEGPGPSVHQITAFLKGAAPSCNALKNREGAAEDPAALAELIMESSVFRQHQPGAEGEQLGGIIVGCLRRAFSQLTAGNAMKTKKGRQQLTKMVTVLEKELLDRLRSYGKESPAGEMEIQETASELREGLKVDDAVSDYIKRRSALEASENKLERVAKSLGVERLQELGVPEALLEGGVPPSGWRKLVVESAPKGGGPGQEDLATMLDGLAALVDRLETEPELTGDVSTMLADMGDAVDAAASSTEAKLDDLATKSKGAGGEVARKEAASLFPEMIQELCQPLAVLNGALDMVVARRLGPLSDIISDTLGLAVASSRRMEGIVSRLLDVYGVPDTLTPQQQNHPTV